MNYCNDNSPFACAWLRELIAQGHLPPAYVDSRSISDVRGSDLAAYTQCHFFSGIGGWPLALQLAGWPLDREVWTGSCPCQPFSCAGLRQGERDERHLWPEFRRLIAERLPPAIFGEQVAGAAGREWLAGVRADLEALGYAVGAADLCAAGVGAPHIRQRLYWVAHCQYAKRGALREHRSNERNGQDGGRAQAHSEPGACGEVRGLAHHGGARLEERAGQPGDARPQCEAAHRSGEAGGMGNTVGNGAERSGARQRELVSASEAGGLDNAPSARPAPARSGAELCEQWSGQRGPEPGRRDVWLASRPHLCLDGKTRRVPLEPALFPLADGLQPARVGILRGAGNAIVPWLAVEFILAFLETGRA